MTTVSGLVGDDYKKWQCGDIIKIAAPTGSGKTTFVLETLLKWAIIKKMPILYMVNRKILKEQIEQRLKTIIQAQLINSGVNVNISEWISVWTYQTIEKRIISGKIEGLISQEKRYKIVIYDECHYFLADSLFNPATDVSFLNLTEEFDTGIQVFMSATIDSMKAYLDNYKGFWSNEITPLRRRRSPPIRYKRMRGKCYYEYPNNADQACFNSIYDYLDIRVIENSDDLAVRIKKTSKKEKWLIFVNSIQEGNKLVKNLANEPDAVISDDVIFIDASYKYDSEEYERVRELQEKSSISKRVVISTSVMDNAISFIDSDLKHIVVSADTQEEFIQMLGRKRADNEKVTLYIYRRNQAFFERRKREVNKALKKYSEYRNKKQRQVLEDIFSGEQAYSSATKICFPMPAFNMIILSEFSSCRLAELVVYYNSMIESLRKDNNAFLLTQLNWLRLSKDKISLILQGNTNSALAEIRDIIESGYVDIELDNDKNIELAKKLRSPIRSILSDSSSFSSEEKNKIYTAIKGDRVFSPENFNLFFSKYKTEPANKKSRPK